MPLPLQYSIQESTIKPKGVTEDYIRLQVSIRPELTQIKISDADYQTILKEVVEGRLVGIVSESGVNIGQFQAGLSGGFPKANFIAPSKSDFRIAFKATLQFLNDARQMLTFERISTITNDPKITGVTFTISDGFSKTVLTNTIALDTAGILKVSGTNFVKGSMTVEVSQAKNAVQFTEMFNSGTKFIENLLNANSITDKSSFTQGPATLKVWRNDNENRNSTFSIMLQ